ncbi:hypothetical protein YM304_11730 [Ilumatobacter coccineus YM16-304]|uniref:N-acetyltransferase domain-containing protein n=1 Tax=Ilumatobacter coccineus (strain NBRC 103263 / KCTC 29153 / YM16-304) TaxID=1313172 RepID=A0A6C7E392_ILUCY|nr:hypothetical protein YM304_11730 [Ilumatobacter coccineus YM16-304]
MKVVAVSSDRTHDLRRRVLRAGEANPTLDWPGDHEPTTTHFAAIADGNVIGVSTWLLVDGRVQLRGMATDPDEAGRGVGSALLEAGIEHARRIGATDVWANARVTALGFYRKHGFVISGPEFVTGATGLPHRLATFDLA